MRTSIDPLELAHHFALPAPPASLVALEGGLINRSWRVGAADGSEWLLQRINPDVFPDGAQVIENIARVTAHIGRRLAGGEEDGRRCLALVRTPDDALGVRDPDGAWWRMYRFIARAHTRLTAQGADDAFVAARAFGEFLAQVADFQEPLHETIPGFHDTARRLAALEDASAADSEGRVRHAVPELELAHEWRGLAHQLGPLLDAGRLPRRVVHNDAKIANVLFDDETGAALCVIDLDTVMPGTALWDVGDLLRSLASQVGEEAADPAEVEVERERLEAVQDGWLTGAASVVSAQERSLILDAGRVIAYEQGVRFLTDYLLGDRYYPVNDGEHNLRRARTQFAVVRQL
ncbi:MAG TPA: aminoglycoside phosphotransferase family protein [Gemmatimonadales bacterium]|nr:aminoglycoside phosphotransferase family protein [Gemmatimonadales bacterium]